MAGQVEQQILLVEDDEGDAMLANIYLSQDGSPWKVTTVGTLAEALDHLNRGEFSVVLLDLGLPDATGLEAVTTIGSAYPDIAIIALTSRTVDISDDDAVKAGAEDFLRKNALSQRELERSLKYATMRHHVRRVEQEAAQQAAREFERMSEMKTQILRGVAHDLNSPLGAIVLELGLLAPSVKGDENAEFSITSMKRSIDRLRAMMQELVDGARLEEGLPIVGEREPVDLVAILNECCDYLNAAGDNPEITIEAVESATVIGDAKALRRIIDNIVGNALKYTLDEEPIHISCKIDDGHAIVEVKDNGAGMDPERLDELFQPFVQLHDQTKIKVSSVGLGLSICHRMVEEHGGKIWGTSEGLGKGSTFGFTLPLA